MGDIKIHIVLIGILKGWIDNIEIDPKNNTYIIFK